MIKIDLDTKKKETSGTINVHGDEETLAHEIYVILRTLSKECLVPLSYAVERHLQDIMEEMK